MKQVFSQYKRLGASILLIGLLVASVTAPAHAATAATNDDGINITTTSMAIDLAGSPGSTLSTTIPVKIGGTKTEKLKVTLMKFSAYGDTGKPAIASRGPNDSYFDWVSFSPQSFTAVPDQWTQVKVNIALPDSAAFGYYYAVVFSRADEPTPTTPKQNNLRGSAAVLILVNAQVPNAKREAQVTSFTVSKHVYEFLPASFTVKLHNSGNIHLVPRGSIYIRKGKKDLATLTVNKAQGNVLPNSNRVFTADWSDGFPVYTPAQSNGKAVLDSHDRPVQSLKWDYSKVSKLKFGHYTAHLVMAYDNGERDVPLEAEVSFWVIPWRILALGLVIIVLAGVGSWVIGREVIRKGRRKRGASK